LRGAEPPDVLKNVRLASRLGTDRVLIQGEMGQSELGYSGLQTVPGEAGLYRTGLLRVTPSYMATFRTEHPTNWRPGDKWKIYTGAGAAVTVVIQELVLLPTGNGPYASAIARFEDEDTANRVSGLRASEFLATPGPGLLDLSKQPLMAFGKFTDTGKFEKALLKQGQKLVASEAWKARDEKDSEARRLDRIFLGTAPLHYDIHLSRWSLPARRPLLFAEIVWKDDRGDAVFGANAVMEENEVLSILDFDPTPGENMRIKGEHANTWDDYEPVFLNAWAIGSRQFVLKFTRFYEGYSAELMEIVRGKGLVPTGIGYGDGA
jgi:hypothetical protein